MTSAMLHARLDAFNAHDLDRIMSFFCDDCVFESPRGPDPWGTRFTGLEQVRAGLGQRFAGLPDVHYAEDQHWACGEHAVLGPCPPSAVRGNHRGRTADLATLVLVLTMFDGGLGRYARRASTHQVIGRRWAYGWLVAENEVLEFADDATGSRVPRSVYHRGEEPDPLYTLANERTYLAWLRLAVTLLAAAVAIDRLFLDHPWFASQALALALVALAFGTCALGVRRWCVTELSLRLRRPLPGFGAPLIGALALVLIGAGVVLLILTPR